MRLAIMQPYFFPYLGYFQLINSVDKFVFYDDVHFIKKGWINRNQVLLNNHPHLFTIPLQKMSQNKLINETIPAIDDQWVMSFMKTIKSAYHKAPYFNDVQRLMEIVFEKSYTSIADLAINSVLITSDYLDIITEFERSSGKFPETKGFEKANRLIAICKIENAMVYINPIGGKELYNKEYFKKEGIQLCFIENELKPYQQQQNDFIPGLSIIDVLMNNSKKEIKSLLSNFQIK